MAVASNATHIAKGRDYHRIITFLTCNARAPSIDSTHTHTHTHTPFGAPSSPWLRRLPRSRLALLPVPIRHARP